MRHLALGAGVLATAVAGVLVLASFTAGQKFPGTDLDQEMAPSQLTDDYRPLKIKEASSGALGDYYSSAYFQFAALGFGPSGENARLNELFEILPVSWTRNQIVRVYGQDFLVTYILEPSIENLREFSRGKPLAEPKLKLKLMRADNIGTLEPFPDLTREKYVEILGRLQGKGDPVSSPALRSQAISNLKQVALGLIIYSADYDEVLPYAQTTATAQRVTQPYLKNDQLWKSLNPKGGLLRYNMGISGMNMATIAYPAKTPMVYDSVLWPDRHRLVAFVDGHVKFVDEEEWSRLSLHLNPKGKRVGRPIR